MVIRFWVMNFWNFSKSLLWTSLSWQLSQNLWCHCVELSIGNVHRCSQNFMLERQNLSWFFQKLCRIYIAMSYKKRKKWNSLYITSGVLHSDITHCGGVANMRMFIIRINLNCTVRTMSYLIGPWRQRPPWPRRPISAGSIEI